MRSATRVTCARILAPDSEGAIRKGRFSEEQMVAIIREADRDPVAAVAKRNGHSEQIIYAWRKRFGALQTSRLLQSD
jgi:putative transposase